jgi:putative membrane protein
MNKLFVAALLILLVATQISWAQEPGTAAPNQSMSQKMKEGATQLMLTNDSFVKKVTIANRAEIDLANMAITKTEDAKIKSFAQRMLKDHTAAGTELQQIAQSKNIEIPKDLDHASKSAEEKLGKLTGADFDKAYSKEMKEAHDKTVALFTAAADDKSLDSELKQFAVKMLPTLRDHQHQAHQL